MKTIELKIRIRTNDSAVPQALANFVERQLSTLQEHNSEVVELTAREVYRLPHADHCAIYDKEPCTCGADEANQ